MIFTTRNTSKRTTTTIETNYKGVDLKVVGTFYPEQREIRYPTDSAQEGIPAYFELEEIFIGDQDAWELLENQTDEILEHLNDREPWS
jgi:hypothetical protein